jgi:hypothetical protein
MTPDALLMCREGQQRRGGMAAQELGRLILQGLAVWAVGRGRVLEILGRFVGLGQVDLRGDGRVMRLGVWVEDSGAMGGWFVACCGGSGLVVRERKEE